MNQAQILINKMYNGDTEAILSGVSSDNDFVLTNAILAGTKQGIKEKKFIEGVSKAQNSKVVLLGFPLASIAVASRHFLEGEKYFGDDEIVKSLLETDFK